MRYSRLEHHFVERIPEQLRPGVLYISIEYATAAHSCCCGCGEEVVTPFTPTDWKMTFDGETVSLNPSIGNWTLACRSHYLIKCGKIIEAEPWTDKQIEAGLRRERSAKAQYYEQRIEDRPPIAVPTTQATAATEFGIWSRLWRTITGVN